MNNYPLYYFPAETKVVSLDSILSKANPERAAFTGGNKDNVSFSEVVKGPDDGPGVIATVTVADKLAECVGYFPDRQEWIQAPSGVYVGWLTPFQINPDLLLVDPCPISSFQNILFSDGSIWECPVLRETAPGGIVSAQHETTFPQTIYEVASDDGPLLQSFVVEGYAELFEESRVMFDWLIQSSETQGFAYRNVFEFALSVIQLRYRYSRALHNVLKGRLFTTTEESSVVRVATGFADLIQREKKNQLTRP